MQDLPDTQLLQALTAPLAQTRSAAAAELARRRHPQALQACLDTLGDATESTHAESTPSVWGLVALGKAALGPLLDRMADADDITRLRAASAFMHISKRRHGFDGNRWPDGAYAGWAAWWRSMGYEPGAEPAERALAVQRLRAAVTTWR